MKTTSFLIAFWLITANLLFSQTTFKNPILTGMNPDPSICRVGDDFYLVTSTFEYFPGLPIYHSKDLVHWKMIGYALSRASNNPLMGAEASTGGQYAPTLRYHDSTFYITCTNYGGKGSQGEFYVTAKNPAGPWSDPIWVGNWCVDPSMSFENDTAYYLTPDNKGSFMLGVINTKTGKFTKPLVKIATGLGGASPEGPHMYKINGYYYLMSAEGGTGYQHMEVMQRSRSPWGPFVASPVNPVISNKNASTSPFQAIGHADLVQLQDSSWWLVCLGIRPKGGSYHHLGRETFLAPVSWNADGWPKGGENGIVKEEFAAPNLPQHVWEKEPVRDNFDSANLRLAWNFIRNPHAADWSLSETPGFLRLKGSKISFKEKDSPAFIGRRQSAFNIVASTKLSFIPVANNEEAGLVVRGNDKNHYDLLVTYFAGKRVVMFRKYLQDKTINSFYKEIPNGDITLRVSATDLEYKFWVQTEGHAAELMGSAASKDLSTEKIGGFTGVYIGMYASGNGTANTNPADFDWFDFEEDPTMPYEWSLGSKDSLNQMVTPTILTAASTVFDKVKLKWTNIENEDGYIIEKFNVDKFDSIAFTQANDTAFTDTSLIGKTVYVYRIKAKNAKGYSYSSIAVSVTTMPKPGPFFGTPALIPGKIEMENYDYGDQNKAYYDSDNVNNPGQYRSDGVDVESCGDTGGGFHIGWIDAGEWLTFTIDVTDTLADIQMRLASQNGGSIKFEIDGVEITSADIAATGGYSNWKTISIPKVKLSKGVNRKLKITFVGAGFNINWVNFARVNIVAVQSNKIESLQVYPNPANDVLNIKSPDFTYNLVEIYNLEGKKLLSQTMNYQAENILNLKLPEGQYILSLYNNDQKKTVRFGVVR